MSTKKENKIIVRDPQELRPRELPLVIELPEGASERQIEFAKVLNAYAYKNPEKWAIKKDRLIKRLENIDKEPLPLQIGKGKITYGKKALTDQK